MKNKSVFIIIILYLLSACVINILFCTYVSSINKGNNLFINNLIYLIESKYDSISREEVYDILNTNDYSYLSKYGISKDDFLLNTYKDKYIKYLLIINITLFIFMILLLVLYLINRKKDKSNVDKLTNLIKDINNKNYKLDLNDISDNEFSLLMNELYKTMIILKESAENSYNDKKSVKKSIEDISHQLKTPLTSITIMLDNLIQNKSMSEEERFKFLRSIEREISNINSLVLILLKLASFDSNTVVYNRKELLLSDIIDKSLQKLSALIDLKDINIVLNIDKSIKCYLDFNMEVEAVTNIIKNALEHSKSEIVITTSDNKMYSEVTIKDDGEGLSKDEINHIFERFYRGNKSKENSIGIGLSLSKVIINKDNGNVEVISSKGEYTIFKIRYFKDLKNVN